MTGPRNFTAPALAVLLAGSLATAGLAQTPFALTNIGQRLDNDDARMTGRGGWGLAVDDSLHPGFKNLASLYSVRHVALDFTAIGDKVLSEDQGGERTSYRTYAPAMRVALPVVMGRLAVTAGFVVDRSTQWTTAVDGSWEAWSDTISGVTEFQRRGSMFKVPLGVAYSPLQGLSLGASVNLQRGTLRESLYNFLQSPATLTGTPLYSSNLLTYSDEYSGTSVTAAFLFSPHSRISVGGSYTPAHDVDVDRKIEMGGLAQRSRSSFVLGMPEEMGLGIQARLIGRWRVGADYQLQKFSAFTGPEEWRSAMQDEKTLSLGLERARASERRGGWSNLPLRLGLRSRAWAYQVGGGEVRETTFSAGTGFPFRGEMGQMDVALSYSLVGDLQDNGLESRVIRLSISVTGLERWW